MKFHFFLILFFILVNKINAMDLLQKIESENSSKKWEFVSDKVMGGISEGKFEILKDKKNNFLRLSGIVSTENNGGFIQIRTNFDVNEENFNGIRIKARGLPSEYFIHIRTSFLLLPWQYYSGKFVVSEVWEDHEILFEDFEKSNFYQPSLFSSSDIKSIGFVAFGKNFEPQLDILKAELF